MKSMEVSQSANAVRYSSKPQSTTIPAKVTTVKSMTAKKSPAPVNTHYYKNTPTNGRVVAYFSQEEEIYEDMDDM